MADAGKPGKPEKITVKTRKIGWFWPLGVVTTSVTGVALVALRGCWHRRMSWPVCMQSHSYQVCLECGVKRLFDEEKFCSYGPFRYDLAELIAWESTKRSKGAPGPSRPTFPVCDHRTESRRTQDCRVLDQQGKGDSVGAALRPTMTARSPVPTIGKFRRRPLWPGFCTTPPSAAVQAP